MRNLDGATCMVGGVLRRPSTLGVVPTPISADSVTTFVDPKCIEMHFATLRDAFLMFHLGFGNFQPADVFFNPRRCFRHRDAVSDT